MAAVLPRNKGKREHTNDRASDLSITALLINLLLEMGRQAVFISWGAIGSVAGGRFAMTR
jgi:hypothetical protein